eukprot:9479118-Pyramimonas_sp.AAC.1
MVCRMLTGGGAQVVCGLFGSCIVNTCKCRQAKGRVATRSEGGWSTHRGRRKDKKPRHGVDCRPAMW